MRTPKTIKNSEYRALLIRGLWFVWLVSAATGARLKKIYKSPFHSLDAANEFIDWLNEREKNEN